MKGRKHQGEDEHGQTTASPQVWESAQGQLRFTLGEFRLKTSRFPVLACTAPILSETRFTIDALANLPSMPHGSRAYLYRHWPIPDPFPILSEASGRLIYAPNPSDHYYVRLKGDFEDYLKSSLDSNARHQFTRAVRRFTEFNGGRDGLRAFTARDEMEEYHRLARAVSSLTYQDRLLGAGLPDTPEFLHDLTAAAARDEVRAYILFHSDRPVAFAYATVHGENVVYDVIGYDPDYKKFSPGTVLLYHLLRSLFAERKFGWFDLGSGAGQHKRIFSTHEQHCAEIYVFPATLRNRLFLSSHHALRRISDSAVSVLSRMGAKDRVKKLFREFRTR